MCITYIQLLKGQKVSQVEALAHLRGALTPISPAQLKWTGQSSLQFLSPSRGQTYCFWLHPATTVLQIQIIKYKHPNLHEDISTLLPIYFLVPVLLIFPIHAHPFWLP